MSNNSVMTISGREIDFLDPNPPERFIIEDIAHALSLKNRWGGHTTVPYTVAEHCMHVSMLIWKKYSDNPRLALLGLAHDFSEAFAGDCCSPLKALLPDYKRIEHKLSNEILAAFSIAPMTKSEEEIVKTYDAVSLATEFRDITNGCSFWTPDQQPSDWKIIRPTGDWELVKQMLITQFYYLKGMV